MSVVESVFVAVGETPRQVAGWLVKVAGCEVKWIEGSAIRLRQRATVHDGWLGVVVQPNGYVLPDAEPDEVQAMDAYAIEIQVRGGSSEDVLHREAGLLFDKLVATRPDVPMLLVHNLDTLVAAHLPGSGTHSFSPLISPDAPDQDTWRPWVVSCRARSSDVHQRHYLPVHQRAAGRSRRTRRGCSPFGAPGRS